jgi:hypothetical protein
MSPACNLVPGGISGIPVWLPFSWQILRNETAGDRQLLEQDDGCMAGNIPERVRSCSLANI